MKVGDLVKYRDPFPDAYDQPSERGLVLRDIGCGSVHVALFTGECIIADQKNLEVISESG
tara:strand:- start:522 stop:701 length:180 start_codon:yes stop_codon:yes gene_type:complete